MKYFPVLLGLFMLVPSLGLAAEPVKISTCAELNAITDMTGDYFISLDVGSAVLDCKGHAFTPIQGLFTGTLNGHGHTIADLMIDTRQEEFCIQESCFANVGLFAELGEGALIENIQFAQAEVLSEDNANRGLIAGSATGAIIRDIVVDELNIGGPAFEAGTPG